MTKGFLKLGKHSFHIFMAAMVLLGIFVFISPMVYPRLTRLGSQLLSAAVMVAAVLVCLLFYKSIYTPLRKLDHRLKKLTVEDGETYAAMDFISDADSIIEKIDMVIESRQHEMEREQAQILMEEKMKYAELQNQINPHFLYNTLENIRAKAILDDNPVIADMTEALSKYFRYNISRDNDIVKLAQELENIQTYVKIQQYRFRDRFEFRIFNHDQTDAIYHCRIPKLTLQPIVENAIFHGMENKISQGHIYVHIDRSGNHVAVIVVDDGVGMDAETLKRLKETLMLSRVDRKWRENDGDGIAMVNINSRLKLLYGPEYGLAVSSIQNVGTQVELILPLMPGDQMQAEG